jgi:predicted nucleotidyltransferase
MREVDTVAKDLCLPYFLVGAMARDVLLGHVFGLNPGRATRDVDVAFALAGWEQFRQLQDRLISGGRFVAVRDVVHRLLFRLDGGDQRCLVDLIPFGGVEHLVHTIAWPPDMQVIMHVAGYGDALQTVLLVQVEQGLLVRVASLPGLAMLKLFAWQEQGLEDARDATDLVTLCLLARGSLARTLRPRRLNRRVDSSRRCSVILAPQNDWSTIWRRRYA